MVRTNIHPGNPDRDLVGQVRSYQDPPSWHVDAYAITFISDDADAMRALADIIDPSSPRGSAEIVGCSVTSYDTAVTFTAGPFYAAIYPRDREAVALGLRDAAAQADLARQAVSA